MRRSAVPGSAAALAAATLLATLAATPSTSASETARGSAPVACVPLLSWEQAQVDRAGNLWVLTERGTAIRRLARDGTPLERTDFPGVRAFDADSEWGIVALDRHGGELFWQRPSAAEPVVHRLPAEAGHVAWLDAGTVAVSATAAADAVVTIAVETGKPGAVLLGGEDEIRPGPGATLLRSLDLAADRERRRLYVLDSVTGRLRLVSFDGRLLADAKIEAHRLAGILDWLEDVDRQAKATGTSQTPFYRVLRTAVGPAGAWVVEQCNEARDRATVAVVGDGAIERREIRFDGPYCSLNFVLWQDQVVFAPPRSQISWRCPSPERRYENDRSEGR